MPQVIVIEQLPGYLGSDVMGQEIVEQINALLTQLSSSIKPLTMRELEGVAKAESNRVYIAVENRNVIVGVMMLVIVRQLAGTKCWIEDVVVDKGHRGQGIAKLLMQRAMNDAPTETSSINLTSKPEHIEAHGLYKGLGFQKRETDVFRFPPGN